MSIKITLQEEILQKDNKVKKSLQKTTQREKRLQKRQHNKEKHS